MRWKSLLQAGSWDAQLQKEERQMEGRRMGLPADEGRRPSCLLVLVLLLRLMCSASLLLVTYLVRSVLARPTTTIMSERASESAPPCSYLRQ